MSAPSLMLFDTASLYFRAYFGLPDSMRRPDGRACNAVRGLADFIARLVSDYSPTHAVCCWDVDWRPGWRVELVPSYKTHRLADPAQAAVPPQPLSTTAIGPVCRHDAETEAIPDSLEEQVPAIVEMLNLAGIATWGARHFEADDVIATLAAAFPGQVYVVTGDRDLFQLVSERVTVLYTGKGVAKHDRVTPAFIEDTYGVAAWQYADFATIRGDSSDGLPGVPGIGEKTAASLIRSFGGLEGIAQAAMDPASSLTPGLRKKLLSDPDVLTKAAQVVQVVDDITLDVELEQARIRPIFREDWESEATRLGLGGAGARLAAALSQAHTPAV